MRSLRRFALVASAASAALLCWSQSAIAAAQTAPLAPPAAVYAPLRPATAPVDLKFDFGLGDVRPGYTRVAPMAAYTDDAGYGYELQSSAQRAPQAAAGDSSRPATGGSVFFSAKVSEGNYNVTVTFGDAAQATTTTFKSESGRLMLERAQVPAGKLATRTFTVSFRTPQLPRLPTNATGREQVSLDQFDRANTRDWDSKLTVEVIGSPAALQFMEITSAAAAPTIRSEEHTSELQ